MHISDVSLLSSHLLSLVALIVFVSRAERASHAHTEHPAVPQPVDDEWFCTLHMQVCLLTECFCFRESVRPHVSPFDPSRKPLDHPPRKRWLTSGIILYDELPFRSEQSSQS